MILPNKYVEEKNTLLYAGALLLNELTVPRSVSYLWNQFKDNHSIFTYERFILALDMLYMFGLIDMRNNRVIRCNHDS